MPKPSRSTVGKKSFWPTNGDQPPLCRAGGTGLPPRSPSAGLVLGGSNVTDWLSATLDLSHHTASRLRTLAYGQKGEIAGSLERGEISLDRAALLTRLIETGLSETEVLSLSPIIRWESSVGS
jgi:hypothetical protein